MRNFEHVNAVSVAGAVKLLASSPGSRPIAGGTDLLTQMKSAIVQPARLVNLKTITGLDRINFDEENGLEIGALVTLDEIAANEEVRVRYPVLHKAISGGGIAATQELRDYRWQPGAGVALLVLPRSVSLLAQGRRQMLCQGRRKLAPCYLCRGCVQYCAAI